METITTPAPVVLDTSGTDIHAEAAALREQGPVAQVELPGGVRAWSITSLPHAKRLMGDPRVSRDARKHWTAYRNGEISSDWPLIGWVVMDNMGTREGADHARLRRLVSKAFTARRVEALRPRIEQITAELIEELSAVTPGDTIDLKRTFAFQLPMQVICELFGVPEESRAEVLHGGAVQTGTRLTSEEAAANLVQWQTAIGELVAAKRENPGDDMTTALIKARDHDGGRLTDDELLGTLFLTLSAGSETVKNLISHVVLNLLAHPEQHAMVTDGRIPWAQVIEEALRVEAPIAQIGFRFATEDIEFEDATTVPKGEPILIAFGAIGRNPMLHGDSADRFDASRENKEHLSFGYGVHYCIGAALARMEAEIALPALFGRFPGLSLAKRPEDLEPQASFLMNGPSELPVRLTS